MNQLLLAWVNNAILAGILLSMLAIFAHAKLFGNPKVLLLRHHPSTVYSFWFFFVFIFTLFIVYIWMYLYLKVGRSLNSLDFQTGTELVGYVSDFCLICAALSYSRGSDFDVTNAAWSVLLGSVLMFVWTFIWQLGDLKDDLFYTSLRLAPDLVLNTGGFFLLGWVFFIRWGGVAGLLYLCITIFYALLQLPGNLLIGFAPFLKDPQPLVITFSILAAGKVPLAFGYISLLTSSGYSPLKIDEPKYWPTTAVKPPSWMQQVGGWIVSLVSSILIATATHLNCDSIMKIFNLSCK